MSRDRIKFMSLTRATEGGWIIEGFSGSTMIGERPETLFAGPRVECLGYLEKRMKAADGDADHVSTGPAGSIPVEHA